MDPEGAPPVWRNSRCLVSVLYQGTQARTHGSIQQVVVSSTLSQQLNSTPPPTVVVVEPGVLGAFARRTIFPRSRGGVVRNSLIVHKGAMLFAALVVILVLATSAKCARAQQLSAGARHVMAIQQGGTVKGWGFETQGSYGSLAITGIPDGAPSATWKTISAGPDITCGVTASGKGYCWGYQTHNSLAFPAGKENENWSQLATGCDSYIICGVTTTGEGVCWGDDK